LDDVEQEVYFIEAFFVLLDDCLQEVVGELAVGALLEHAMEEVW